jgi:hypothetical protein
MISEFTFNVSAMKDYIRCPFRYWAKWIMNQVPKNEAQPLAFGKLIHRIFEQYHRMKTPSMLVAIHDARLDWVNYMTNAGALGMSVNDIGVGTKVLKQLDDMSEALVQWHDIYTFDNVCLEVEEPFELDLGNGIRGKGRPDRVAVRDGLLWHVQHKALAAGMHFAVFTDLQKRSYHEHLYAEGLWAKYCGEFRGIGGTQFDLIRKLKYRTKMTKANPLGETKSYEEMFQQIPVAIDLEGPVHLHVMETIKKHAAGMRELHRRWDEYHDIPAPNDDMNGGMYGNSPDEYFRVLTGEYELDDPRYFKTREDTYAGPEEGTEE